MAHDKIYLQRRTKGGVYYLVIVRTTNQKRHYKKISCKTKSKTEALHFLKSYEKNLEQPTLNPNLKISDIQKPILDYVKSNTSPASHEKYKLTFKFLLKVLGDMKLSSVKERDIEQFKSTLAKSIRKESVNSYVRYIKSIWNLLVKLDFMTSNSLRDLKQFKISEKEIVSFTENEMELILNSVSHTDIKNIIMFAVETGLRISELLNLKIKNIDFENEYIKVNNTNEFKTKSGKNRLIPFNEKIKEIINLALLRKGLQKTDNDKFLFVSKFNIPYKRNFVTVYFRRKLDELKFDKRYHFHCLRATFIMNLVRKGVNPIIIQKLAGHSSLTVTQRYCFVQITDLRQALNL